MRVVADSTLLAVEPGASTGITIEVVNTDDVIAGVSANIIGLATEYVSAQPQMLPLFPDASGKVHLDLNVPAAHPAGRHPLTVQVVSHGTTAPPDYIDVDLQVAAHPGLRVTTKPRIVRARRSGRFVLELANTGNVPLDVALTGVDPDRLAEVTFSPDTRRIEPNTVVPVLLTVKGPRMFTGAEADRLVSIEATARPAYAFGRVPGATDRTEEFAPIPADRASDAAINASGATALLVAPPAPADPEAHPGDVGDAAADSEDEDTETTLVRQTSVRLRQKPTVGRGLLTALILLGIIALWAGAFLLGLAKVFAGDPMTKQAPASFFASSQGSDANGAVKDANGAGADGAGGAAANDAPAGALAKDKQMPPGTGGTITGTVTSTTDRQPVGRILVTALRQGRDKLVPMSSAATQTDGTYTLSGLFPTSYYLKFSRDGFRDTWFPNQPTQATAQRVTAAAQVKTQGVDVAVTGEPASISGKVDYGEAAAGVVTTVTARTLVGPQTNKRAASAATDAGGNYKLSNLPAPGTYELSFVTPGYQTTTMTETVSGNDQRIEPTVTPGADTGQISGDITDEQGNALGGVTVTTTLGGQTVSVGTPTTGQVGHYILANLPTPATYVVTASKPGYGSRTEIVNVAAGKSGTQNFPLSSGSGSVTGMVTDGKKGLGGVTVTATGTASTGLPPSTTTLTSGQPGQFILNGLRGSGSYTITASKDGYATTTAPLTLPLSPGTPFKITLGTKLGKITGKVTLGKSSVAGATVTATNGQNTFTTTTNSSDGRYVLANLPAGTFSVTVSGTGINQTTALAKVRVGDSTRCDIGVTG